MASAAWDYIASYTLPLPRLLAIEHYFIVDLSSRKEVLDALECLRHATRI
jgi:hypothetical protein